MTPTEPEAIRAAAEQSVDPRVDLAVQRTELALDRTQLAWVRTTFALTTAGFALDRLTAALHQARVLAGTNWVETGHLGGITLTASATILLGIASFEYWRQTRRLARLKGGTPPRFPPALLLSLLVVLMGCSVTAFVLVWD